MCCGCLVDITRLMEDCHGLTGLKVNLTDLDFFFFFFGGGGVEEVGNKLFHCA